MALKIGSVEFLNAKPLTYGFAKDSLNDYELLFDTPSNLSSKLRKKEIDIGLIPVMEYLQGAGEFIIRDAALASKGPVGSVFLLREEETFDFERIAVDTRSRSSIALLKILLSEKGKSIDNLYPFDPKTTSLSGVASDAVLVIGDEALIHGRGEYTVDLGEWWFDYTGLPFVYAVWVSNVDLSADQRKAFCDSKRAGLANLKEIIATESKKHDIPEEILFDYYTSRIVYDLGSREIRGIQTFQALLYKHGLINLRRDITIL